MSEQAKYRVIVLERAAQLLVQHTIPMKISVAFFAITFAGNDWYFFTDTDQCGAQYAIKEVGDHIIRLK